ncbi:MAG: branched-chain amino acid transporter AzlD [Ruminococcaceae bacterium]|nr:branched-chain amino acid transporter AzlD [Oscillospiraceae bacterium]
MTNLETIITVAVIVLGTAITRFLPFLIFRSDKPTPKYMQFLGNYLPPAVFGMLVIYCLKDVLFVFEGTSGLPELISLAATLVLHLSFRKMLLSLIGGTACYMLLLQFVF